MNRFNQLIRICPYFLLFFLLVSCGEEEEPVVVDCVDVQAEKAKVEQQIQSGAKLEDVDQGPSFTSLIWSDGQTTVLSTGCVNSVDELPGICRTRIIFDDGSLIVIDRNCAFQYGTEFNPTGNAPLSSWVNITSNSPVSVDMRVIGKNGPLSDVTQSFSEVSTDHRIPVHGLYPEYLNKIEFTYHNSDGQVTAIDTFEIQTNTISDLFPETEIVVRDEARMEPGFHLVPNRSTYNPNLPFIIDPFGDIRWVLDYTGHPVLGLLGYDVGMERLENGNFYFGDWHTDAIYEVDLFGDIINQWNLLDIGYYFHHQVQEKPDGNFLVTASREGSRHQNGGITVEDYVIEIDRQTGALINEWDLKESLDEWRVSLDNKLGQQPIDWAHVNAVTWLPADSSIIISCRVQGVFKLGYNNELIWVLGPHEGWGPNRRGEDLNDFLLTPISASGVALPEDVANGRAVDADFEWCWYQHAPLIMPNGNIMLFDNGPNRQFIPGNNFYSRAVEYEIDEENMTIKQVWQYGKERGLETFSSIVSDVDRLEQTGNILFSPGAWVNNGQGKLGAKIVEVDYNTREVVFEAKVHGNDIVFHRTERLLLYP